MERCVVCGYDYSNSKLTEVRVPSNVRAHREELFTVARCPRCRSIHALDTVDLDAYYKDYPLRQHTLTSSARIAFKKRLSLLKRVGLQRSHTILDFGCGSGVFVQFLKEQGYQNCFGYDPYYDGDSLSSADLQTYDFIVSQDVIEHVVDLTSFFSQIDQLLNPGGTVVIGTPDAEKIRLNSYELYQLELHQPYHRHIFSSDGLLEYARRAGFEAEKVSDRFYFDTLVPGINVRFFKEYLRETENLADQIVEPISLSLILKSPRLLWLLFFGYLVPKSAATVCALYKLPT